MPANVAGGGVFDTARMFHDASAASISPARKPTRGSGLGAMVDTSPGDDMLTVLGEGEAVVVVVAGAHAAAAASTSASDSVDNGVE